jgi:hypothetical protein
MRLLLTAIIVGLVAALMVLKSGYLVLDRGKIGLPRVLKQGNILVDDVPALAEAMANGSASVRYAALIFSTPDRPSSDDAINLQMSMENGKAGFDWILLAPRNIEDQEKFESFAHEQGLDPVAETMNGVSYLRVECADVAKFTTSVVTQMYHHPGNEPLGLVYEGFAWRQA